jgi:hypothetical protein
MLISVADLISYRTRLVSRLFNTVNMYSILPKARQAWLVRDQGNLHNGGIRA